jgi:rhamnosyltransferase subunit B
LNILITTLGSYGDVYPMVGLGVRLAQRGHAVTLLTNPFFEDLARKYGLDLVPIGTRQEYERFANHPSLFDPRKSLSVLFDTLLIPGIRGAYERLCERVQPGCTVIVSSITVLAARLVQEKQHIPNITVHLTPMAFKSAYEMPRNAMFPFPDWLPLGLKRLYWWVADKAVVDRMLCPELNAFRKELGLAPASRILTRWGHSPQMVIALFPSWYATPQPDWPPGTQLTGFPLFDEGQEARMTPDVQAFLADGDAPIVFMPGSLMQQAEQFFRTALQACQELGKRAIFLSRYGQHIPSTLPQSIRHFEYVPFRQLLPHVDALVHHGGIGTCAQALRAGVPQLIHPMAYDQHDNAWRLKRLGVGDWIVSRDWQGPTVTAKLLSLTTSRTVREHCQRVADKFVGRDPLLETCELVESALPGGAPGQQSSLACVPTWRKSYLAESSSAGKI